MQSIHLATKLRHECQKIGGIVLLWRFPININPVKALFWTAVINGVLAPFLLVGILVVACDRKLMNNQPSSMLSRVIVAITTLAMFAAAIAMFVL